MKRKLLLSGWLLLCWLPLLSQQHRCSTDEIQAAREALDPTLQQLRENSETTVRQFISNNPDYRTGSVVTIPVVFHIIYNTPSQNIPDARIYEQLEVLNKDYSRTNADAGNTRSQFLGVAANTQIQFCLAQRTPQGNPTTGILRISTSSTYLPSNPSTLSTEWDRTKYFNVYVGNLSGSTLGYAYLPATASPGTDHAVILFSAIGGPNNPGTINPYHLGRTLTHEAGHWFNLQHTFSGGCSGLTATTCTSGGDYVCDTPPVSSSAFGCPGNNPNTCTETSPFPPPYTSDMVNMYENYMDYTDDNCMNIFTSGQATRMNSAITLYRSGLLSSNGCVPVGLEEALNGSFVSVSPNPSHGEFQLQFMLPVNLSVDISVVDLRGVQIFKGTYDASMNSTVKLDLSDFPSGVYQLVVQTERGQLVKKLVKVSDW